MMKLFNFSPKDNLNEVIFEHRNKNYGAYNLRTEEGNILQKALFFGVAAFVTVVAIPLIMNAFTAKIDDGGITDFVPPIELINVPDEEIKKPEVVKAQPVQTNDLKVVKTDHPEPTSHLKKKEKTIATISERKNAAAGFDDKDGKDTKLNIVVPDVNVPKGPFVEYVKPYIKPQVIIDENVIVAKPDKEAKFPGGIDNFRNQVSKYFAQGDFDGSGELMKTTITFVVEKNGTISNIKANGKDAYFNKEALKTLNKIQTTWIPAEVKGVKVRSAFTMPIAMQFD